MIRRLNRSPLPFSALFVALTSLATAVPAHALDCQAVDTHDLPRDCTAMEEYGECLYEAKESTAQCKDAADGSWWRETVCDVGAAFDIIFCTVALPFGAFPPPPP